MSERETIKVSIRFNENSEENAKGFLDSLQRFRKSPTYEWIKNLNFGDSSALYLRDKKYVIAESISGRWNPAVQWKIRNTSKDNAQGVTEKVLKTITNALPADSEEDNIILADSASHCTWAAPLLLSSPVGNLTTKEVADVIADMGIRDEDFNILTRMPRQVRFLAPYKSSLVKYAAETNLTPELLGAIVLTEMRGLDPRVLDKDFFWNYLGKLRTEIETKELISTEVLNSFKAKGIMAHSWAVAYALDRLMDNLEETTNISELHRDQILSYFFNDVSVGIIQRQVSSMIKLGVHKLIPELSNLSNSSKPRLDYELREWLLDDDKAIRLCAYFIRTLADRAAKYDGARENQLKMWVAKRACGKFDLAPLSKHGNYWNLLHTAFLGWKYNSGNLNDLDGNSGEPAWGDFFLISHRDIIQSGFFN
jgi:hypothetical protein